MDASSQLEMATHHESQREYSGIRFEPAHHPFDKAVYEKLAQEIFNGNLRAHVWNKEAGIRIKQYGPLVMAIDGLFPFEYTREDGNLNLDETFNI